MDEKSIVEFSLGFFGAAADCPFKEDIIILRHSSNRKWFAALLDVPAVHYGKSGADIRSLNLKCEPELVTFLSSTKQGIRPGYHMNRKLWISVDIAEADEEDIKQLIEISYRLTAPKYKAKKEEK